jgi:hypothetical protein
MRIDASYGGGRDTVFLAARTGEILSYEKDGEELHSRYGGEQYYRSRSGLSGAGYLEPKPQDNDLIEVGYYYTNAREIWYPEKSPFGYVKLYVPIKSHGGVQYKYPVVMLNEVDSRIAFLPHWQKGDTNRYLLQELKKFDSLDLDFQAKETTYFLPPENEPRVFGFSFANPQKCRGVRITRFFTPPGGEELTPEPSLLSSRLHLQEFEGGWFHRHQDGYWDMSFPVNPREIYGEIAEGWVGDGEGLFWRRDAWKGYIEAFVEIERSERYRHENLPTLVEYEEVFPILDWFSKPSEEHRKTLLTKVIHKTRKDYVYACHQEKSPEELLQTMGNNPDAVITVEHSLEMGNCELGTRRFMTEHHILEDQKTLGELLENPQIGEMINNYHFRKVVAYALES